MTQNVRSAYSQLCDLKLKLQIVDLSTFMSDAGFNVENCIISSFVRGVIR